MSSTFSEFILFPIANLLFFLLSHGFGQTNTYPRKQKYSTTQRKTRTDDCSAVFFFFFLLLFVLLFLRDTRLSAATTEEQNNHCSQWSADIEFNKTILRGRCALVPSSSSDVDMHLLLNSYSVELEEERR